MNNADLDKKKKVATSTAKAELKVEQDKIIDYQAFNSLYFYSKSHFEDDDTQNYLLLQPMYKYFRKIGNTELISAWESKRLCH